MRTAGSGAGGASRRTTAPSGPGRSQAAVSPVGGEASPSWSGLPAPSPSEAPARVLTLATPLSGIAGVPRAVAQGLAAMGVATAGALLDHLPLRYEWVHPDTPVADLPPGAIVAACGTVTATRVVLRRPRPRFEAVIVDQTGRLEVVWFHMAHLRHQIHPGMRVRVQGKAMRGRGAMRMVNPGFRILEDGAGRTALPPAGPRLRAVYPASAQVSSARIERLVRRVLPRLLAAVEDPLPEAVRTARALPARAEAYRLIHAPESEDDPVAGRRRLAYDDLLLLQLGVQLKRAQLRGAMRAIPLRWDSRIDQRIRARIPFPLTPGQEAVIADVVRDLTTPTPTNRLIQGDVGSGKTIVALYAMLLAVASRHQAALMAPTAILAEQHCRTMVDLLAGSRVRVELLTGAGSGGARAALLRRIARGEVDIVVGTHALLSGDVQFASLAVAVIDEQHRFGVSQRALLRSKGTTEQLTPHVLVMTATPIPRTLAIAVFGDLDVSEIAGLPAGRQPVTTRVVGPEKRDEVFRFVRRRLERGEQAYIVVPAIGEGVEGEDVPAVRALVRELQTGPLAGMRLGALHGRMTRQARDQVMSRFRAGAVQALVCTTIVEVGVDVPNATLMIILGAERFGLAQLHQLRGRVGRGDKASVCVCVAQPGTPQAAERLHAFAQITDGFRLAEIDARLRGPGEIFGAQQWGQGALRVADLWHHSDLLQAARADAARWIAESPRLDRPQDALIRRRLLETYGKGLGLGDVG